MVEMFLYLVDQYVSKIGVKSAPVKETPPTGCLHPGYDGFFSSPQEYYRYVRFLAPCIETSSLHRSARTSRFETTLAGNLGLTAK